MADLHIDWSQIGKYPAEARDRFIALAPKAAYKVARTRGLSIIQSEIDKTEGGPPVDTGAYRRGFKVARTKDRVVIYNATFHAGIIEYGRRKNSRMPPWSDPDAALGLWVRRVLLPSALARAGMGKSKHVSSSSLRARGRSSKADARAKRKASIHRSLSFLVARSIAKRGIKGRYVLGRSKPKIQRAWMIELKRMFEAGK